jgi:tyrosine-protein kinase Etk/Wzc
MVETSSDNQKQDSGSLSTLDAAHENTDEADIDLLQYFIIIAKHKRSILLFTFVVALASIVVTLLLPNKYTATAVLMPPRQDQSSATALLGELIGKGSSGAGIATALGLQNPNDLYVGILRGRTIADNLIGRFKLQELYDLQTSVETREELEDNTTVTAGKNGLIAISVEDRDPKRAAAIANAYVEELERLTAELTFSEASQRRKHFQEQVDAARIGLAKADQELKVVQEQTGLIRPPEQAHAIFGAMAALRGEIAAKEVELTAIKTFATNQNPDYARVQGQLSTLRGQLVGLEKSNKLGLGDILLPTSKVPEAGVRFLEKWRNVKYYETLYELLAKQLEFARIDEGKNSTIIQLVDKAVEPDKKSRPKRAVIVLVSTLVAGVLGLLYAFIKEGYENAKQDPKRSRLIRKLRENLRLFPK